MSFPAFSSSSNDRETFTRVAGNSVMLSVLPRQMPACFYLFVVALL